MYNRLILAAVVAAVPFALSFADEVPPIALVRDYGMRGTTNNMAIPAGLRYTDEEAAAIVAKRRAEWRALGYEEKQPYHSGHFFGNWTKGRKWEKHRDWFGLTPYGSRGVEMPGFPPWMRSLSKMCVSNEGVVDERIAMWKRAGCPWLLVAGENDGLVGYCRCEKCRALDADLPGEPFLHNKTDRYLDFWNRIAAKARAVKPDVKVCVFLYSLMRHPPRRTRVAYPDNMIFSYVPSFHDQDPAAEIAGWKKMGMKHFYMRPNYLCNRTVFPIAREKYVYDMHRLFRDAGGKGDSFDNTRGVPAMDFEFYVALRVCVDPDVPFETIERDWYARYGAAAGIVRSYHERVRARCDIGWAKLLSWLQANDVEFLDDSHFSRCYHRLHTVAELDEDLALLKTFDAAALDGDAKTRFENLKLNVRHQAIARRALETRSEADKAALVEFRVAHRDALGYAWGSIWNKGEFTLWNDTPGKHAYENTGIASFVERFERGMAEKPAKKLIKELKSPLDEPRIDPLQLSVVRNGGPKKPSDYVPEDVRLTAEEMKALYDARAAEWASLGYKQTYPKDWKKLDFSIDGAKMRAAHPEFFGLTLSGERKVSLPDWPKWFEGLTKWCVSNDALVDAIVAKWRKAGRPYLLRFYENDGLLGFCRCEKCCALDADLPGENFLDHKTDRYLSLFNRVAAKARAERPDVSVVTFFYSVYRFPPRREKVAFPENQVCILIPSLIDDVPAYLEGWRKAGMKRFGVRPNYLCHYIPIPRGLEKRLYDEHRLFRDAGSIGMEWDTSTGTPANDFDFYVAVRLAAHPDLTFEEIEDGWCARFGAAAETVRAYYRRIRARCDRSWPELIRYFRENHLDFLDDGHLSCYTPRLHTEAALAEDIALLKRFDASALEGVAKTRFEDLVFMAEHALATWKANVTKSKADKAALHAMRVKNRLKLGDGTRKWYKVAEVLLWDDTPRNRVYYQDFGVARLADAYERIHSVPPIAYVGNGMKATADSKILPEGLRYTEEEASAIAKRRADEAATLGYTGSRETRPYHSGHYFTRWRKGKVWDEHRDFFGLTPRGTRGVEMGGAFPQFVKYCTKVCVSNEGAVDQRIDDWKKDGCPWLLIAGETDGLLGYCRCEKCRALDADLPGEPFLRNKTDRYLDFWNRIAAKARAIRPDVKVSVFLYSALRHPPRRVRVAHPDNMLFSYVPTFHERDIAAEVAEWKRMGMKNFYMRPNYLCNYTAFPIAREKYLYDVHRIFREAGGKGDYLGGTRGCAAMGMEFYTAVRMCADPDVPFSRIEDGWYARYGAASDVVRRYHERVRARCDERWDKLLAWLEAKDVDFIDDGHFSRCYHRLHDVADLEGDLALLESFDDSTLSGEAKERFSNLKLCAKHYIITRRTFETKSEADKKALVAFRVAHRDALGTSWSDMWNKGEIELWNNSLEKRAYMDLGISTYVEAIEQGMAKKTSKQLIKELKSPLD